MSVSIALVENISPGMFLDWTNCERLPILMSFTTQSAGPPGVPLPDTKLRSSRAMRPERSARAGPEHAKRSIRFLARRADWSQEEAPVVIATRLRSILGRRWRGGRRGRRASPGEGIGVLMNPPRLLYDRGPSSIRAVLRDRSFSREPLD